MNWQDAGTAVLRVGIVYVVLLVFTRLLGKKQINQLTFFHYVTGITLGSVAANIMISDESLVEGLLILAVLCALSGLTAYINLKSGSMRSVVDGQPVILIKRGTLMRNALRGARMNMDDLTMLLRKQSVFSVTEVEYAILEPNGELSVLKKAPGQPATRADLQAAPPEPEYLPCGLIVDGRVIRRNLLEMGLDEEWLAQQLENRKIGSAADVFYAELTENGGLHVEKK